MAIGGQEQIKILEERPLDLIFGERFHSLELERLDLAQLANQLPIPGTVFGHSRSHEQQ